GPEAGRAAPGPAGRAPLAVRAHRDRAPDPQALLAQGALLAAHADDGAEQPRQRRLAVDGPRALVEPRHHRHVFFLFHRRVPRIPHSFTPTSNSLIPSFSPRRAPLP